MKKLISFIIPCYRSEKTIEAVLDEILEIMSQKEEYTYEMITINDGSPDNVLAVLERRARANTQIKVIDFAKNMGKHSALMAGYRKSKGDIIVCVDDDFQCPVDKLWDLIEPLNKGYDVSIAKYGMKKESLFRNLGSYLNGEMAHSLIQKPKELQLSNFLAMKRFIVEEIINYHNPYPYIDGLILRATNKIVNVEMKDRERLDGKSGYTLRKLISQTLNGFTAFSIKPLRISTVIGIFCAIIGFLATVYTVINKFIHPDIMLGYSSLMAVILFIGGMIMLMLGLIGEYVGRIYISINNSPQYVIRKTMNID